MYRLIDQTGDALAVPRLVFSRLTAPGGDDVRFRVALYLIENQQADAATIARELRIPRVSTVQQALNYWEGAGLVQQQEAPPPEPDLPVPVRQRLTTQQIAAAAQTNKALGGMITELQRIFGGVVSQADINVFLTLHLSDELPADLVLTAASHCAAQGKCSARYIEKLLLNWRREGITDALAADRYLKLLDERALHEQQVGTLLGIPKDAFTAAEKKRIARWFEEYAFSTDMLEAAKFAAGSRSTEINYLDGILKKWHAKGYTSPRDLQREGPNNLRVQGPQPSARPEDDALASLTEYVPLKKRRKQDDNAGAVYNGETHR